MRILFVHQNFPGQYRHLAASYADDPRNIVVAIGDQANIHRACELHPRIRLCPYPSPAGGHAQTHPYLLGTEASVRRGQAVARLALELRNQGFVPDVICVHPGWGESLFLRDVFPTTKILLYLEFFYRAKGSDMQFDPEYPSTLDDACRLRIRNSTQLLSLDLADGGISPTRWQRDQFPDVYRDRIHVIHDGVDTARVRPGSVASLVLPDGRGTLRSGDEVVTYVARNLEPYRGIHPFLRSLPAILAARPNAHVLIVGGDDVSYGRRLPEGESYRSLYMREIEGNVDASRIHFLGKLPYDAYLDVLRLSSAHVYLTYPFVLSWSMLEAMACECLLIGSSTSPVQEVLQHERNGLLVDFFSPASISEAVVFALAHQKETARLRKQARMDVQSQYDLHQVCLPKLKSFLLETVSGSNILAA
jgi:glycosyltransferase involved in cell wall biosynthesis